MRGTKTIQLGGFGSIDTDINLVIGFTPIIRKLIIITKYWIISYQTLISCITSFSLKVTWKIPLIWFFSSWKNLITLRRFSYFRIPKLIFLYLALRFWILFRRSVLARQFSSMTCSQIIKLSFLCRCSSTLFCSKLTLTTRIKFCNNFSFSLNCIYNLHSLVSNKRQCSKINIQCTSFKTNSLTLHCTATFKTLLFWRISFNKKIFLG